MTGPAARRVTNSGGAHPQEAAVTTPALHEPPVNGSPAGGSPAGGAPGSAEASRRTVLCGLAAALLGPAALAAACGGGSSGGGSGGAGGGGTGAGAGSGGNAGAALARLSDVPVGGGIVVATPSGMAVLVQPTAGTVKGFNAACTHQGTIVGTPKGGVITCPNHGSQFNAADGSVERGPAAAPLTPIDVRVQGTDVVLA
jgi:nitrite reductase/ring-hydroxylating ferredoxin subunit